MYNIGLIGTGFITRDFVSAITHEERANAYAICSRNIDTANQFKEENNLEVAYDDYSKMLLDEKVDVIYIASPNAFHFKHAKLAIESGKHVLVEKPMALLPAEVAELFELGKKHNVFVMEAYVSLTYNTFNTVKTWIDTLGEIGKVDFHLDQQTRHFEAYLDGADVNVFNGKMGGGALRDLGPYTLYPLMAWFGEPMQSHYFSTKNDLNADETTLVLCHYETFSATVHVSKMLSDKRSSIISGDYGYIEIDHINEMKTVKKFDVKGVLQDVVTCDYTHRMVPELTHFLDVLDSGKYSSQVYTQQLAEIVHMTISENYK